MPELTTTSYAILSLLGVRSWTTYELAQQMRRSVGQMWPRATSVVYEEPKRLVREGLATSSTQRTGRRRSTVYAITDDGRAALARWLAEPGGGPTLEFEALLKVAFADLGSLAGLHANLAAVRDQAARELDEVARRNAEYAETGGPYPDRLPVISLAARFYQEQALALQRWVDWAEDATRDWTGVTRETGAALPADSFTAPPGAAVNLPPSPR